MSDKKVQPAFDVRREIAGVNTAARFESP